MALVLNASRKGVSPVVYWFYQQVAVRVKFPLHLFSRRTLIKIVSFGIGASTLEIRECLCEDLLHKAIQVERQLKFKCSSKFASSSSSSWRSNWKNNKVVTNPKEEVKAKYSNAPSKGKINTNISYRSHDIKCFRCQGVGHIAS
ncbi:hypothetical protein CR513_30060, partial [Mucuna pruriens]